MALETLERVRLRIEDENGLDPELLRLREHPSMEEPAVGSTERQLLDQLQTQSTIEAASGKTHAPLSPRFAGREPFRNR